MGKGDKRRPTHVDDKAFEESWERTFKPRKKRPKRAPVRKPRALVVDDDLPDYDREGEE